MTGSPMVISVMGSGHTGSTVLAVVLGNHPGMACVGELHKLPRSGWVRAESRRCSCGAPLHECAYWTDVYQRWCERVRGDPLSEYIRLQHHFERSKLAWPRLLAARWWRRSKLARYATMTTALYEAIRDVSGKQMIVDSSKAPVRNYALLRNNDLDARVVHLVRDGRAVVWSQLGARGRNAAAGIPEDRRGRAAWRTSLHWVTANLQSDWVRKAGRGRTLRLTYERFVENPQGSLSDVGELVGEDLRELASAIESQRQFDVGHTAGGNRLRMARQISVRPNFEWREHLSRADERTFWRSAGWLAKRYGYRR